jgi:hypothetical protein
MKLTGPTAAGRWEESGNPNQDGRAEGTGGWVRVELKVRPSPRHWHPEHAAHLRLSLLEWEREFMPTTPKGECRSYRVRVKE